MPKEGKGRQPPKKDAISWGHNRFNNLRNPRRSLEERKLRKRGLETPFSTPLQLSTPKNGGKEGGVEFTVSENGGSSLNPLREGTYIKRSDGKGHGSGGLRKRLQSRFTYLLLEKNGVKRGVACYEKTIQKPLKQLFHSSKLGVLEGEGPIERLIGFNTVCRRSRTGNVERENEHT